MRLVSKSVRGFIVGMLFVFSMFIFLSNISYSGNLKKVIFGGKQVKGGVGHMPKITGDMLVVKNKAIVISYTKQAPSFCIWKKYGQQPIVCNYNSNFIGYTLEKGRYVILPNIGKNQKYGRASVTVKCSNCYVKKIK